MTMSEMLYRNGHIRVTTTRPLCIYMQTRISQSECLDITTNDNLKLDNIDDSYGLDI